MNLHRARQNELAQLLRLSARQVHNLVNEGMPVVQDGARRYYDAPECLAWYLARQQGHGTLDELDAAKLRVDSLKADHLELELAERRGQLMGVAEFERLLADALARVDAKLRNLPQRCAAVAWSLDLTERVRQAMPLVDEVRAELHEGTEVPEPDAGEATTEAA